MKHLRRRARAALVSVLASAFVVVGTEAQVSTQAYVGAGYADGFTGMVGVQFLNVFLPDEDARVVDGQNALHGYAAAGVRSNPGDLTAQFGLAYLFPTANEPAYWGPVVLASINPAGGGGGLRLAGGFGAGLAWLTVGAIKLDGRDGVSAIVNLDVTTDFICDLVSFC